MKQYLAIVETVIFGALWDMVLSVKISVYVNVNDCTCTHSPTAQRDDGFQWNVVAEL